MILKRRAKLGFESGDDKNSTILNRIISVEEVDGEQAVVYEPDPRHAEIITHQLGLTGKSSKGVTTPGAKSEDYFNDTPISKEEQTLYRSSTMRYGYLAQDLPHLQHSFHKIARGMSTPTVGGFQRLKRAGRFLRGHPRWRQVFRLQEPQKVARVYSDSDWAQDKLDRKSISCTVMMIGEHMIKSSVSTQANQSLSSGEAEFVATVRSTSLGLGLKSMAADFGDKLTVEVWTDSSASKGICSRIGLGKVRHLDTGLLWIQNYVEKGIIKIKKVKGTENPADLGTKDLDQQCMTKCLKMCNIIEASGRHPLALRAALGDTNNPGASVPDEFQIVTQSGRMDTEEA